MINLKKLAFAPLFLLSFAYLCYLINPFLTSTDSLFSLSLNALIQPLVIAALILLTSLLFTVFATLAQDWIIVGITVLIAGIIPIIFLSSPINLYLAIGSVIAFVIIFANLLNKLKTYLNFQPSVLFSPSIRNLSTILALIISILYFQSISNTISQKGFELPDSIIESTLQLSNPGGLDQTSVPQPQLPVLSKGEITLLKQHPELLSQRGIDPKILNQLDKPTSPTSHQNPVTSVVKSQIQNMLKPYQPFIAPILAILIFFTLTSLISLLSLITPILLWMIFSILKAIGFIKFSTEMREVKKLVV